MFNCFKTQSIFKHNFIINWYQILMKHKLFILLSNFLLFFNECVLQMNHNLIEFCIVGSIYSIISDCSNLFTDFILAFLQKFDNLAPLKWGSYNNLFKSSIILIFLRFKFHLSFLLIIHLIFLKFKNSLSINLF